MFNVLKRGKKFETDGNRGYLRAGRLQGERSPARPKFLDTNFGIEIGIMVYYNTVIQERNKVYCLWTSGTNEKKEKIG